MNIKTQPKLQISDFGYDFLFKIISGAEFFEKFEYLLLGFVSVFLIKIPCFLFKI